MTGREYSDRALRSFFGAREGGQDRPQSVFTPQLIVDAILQVWPEGIELDPCANQDAIIPAARYLYEFGEVAEWPDRTYLNPPYGYLKNWCRRMRRGHEHMMLAPVRPNRGWFVRAMCEASVCCFLRPFAFLGHIQSFPAPLAMLYYGDRIEAFTAAFGKHGELVEVKLRNSVNGLPGIG
jgi:hypothetical protein